jgi:hypothetical protein
MAGGLSIVLPLAISTRDGAYALHDKLSDVARQNLKMIILTSPGERVMAPSFGVGIRSYLFEPLNPSTNVLILSSVRTQVSKYLPYISLQDLQVLEFGDDNMINLRIKYSIPSIKVVDEFIFPISV